MTSIQTTALLIVSLLSLSGFADGPATDRSVDDLHRAADLENGVLSFTYEVRDGVRGNGYGISIARGDHDHLYFRGRLHHMDEMEAGPARIVLTIREGRIRGVDLAVGREFPRLPEGTRDLGPVPAAAAAGFCLDLVPTTGPDQADDLVLAAVVARGADITGPLLEIIKDRTLSREIRRDTVMWLAMFAGEKVAGSLGALALDQDEDFEVREHAVFALSQRDDGLALLLSIARENREPRLQRAAIMALAEFDDAPEVIALLEEILLGE